MTASKLSLKNHRQLNKCEGNLGKEDGCRSYMGVQTSGRSLITLMVNSPALHFARYWLEVVAGHVRICRHRSHLLPSIKPADQP